jgi:hypothetical protein
VWQPANPNDNITRILFPGSTPQHKVFEGLDRLKHLEFLKYPVCTARSISPSASTVGITSRASSKQRSAPAVIDKLLPGEGVKAVSKTIGSTMESNKQVIKTATIPVAGHVPETRQIKSAATTAPISTPVPPPSKPLYQTKQKVDKLTSKTEPPKVKTELNKSLEVEKISAKTEKATKLTVTEMPKSRSEPKPKSETRTSISKSKTDTKAPRSAERKSQKPAVEKKNESAKSSPTTPKKSVEGKMNGVASKAETAKLSRISSKSQPSPTATPAKSTKEANNRKVVESKYQHISRMSSSSYRGSTTKIRRKEQQETPSSTKAERKPISRRPKPGSPSKANTSGSPAKSSSAKSTPTPSVKSDKDGVIHKVKGEADRITTDSSAVSTPSTVDPDTAALKVKAVESSEATTAISEPEKLRKEKEEKIATDKEVDTVQPEKEESDAVSERAQMTAPELPVGEVRVHREDFKIEERTEKVVLPAEGKYEEGSPVAEEDIEEVEEDKEAEVAEEIKQVMQAVLETYDIEATEEEKTDDVEEEEDGEEELQRIDERKSLADDPEFRGKQHKEIKVEEELGEEENEEEEEEVEEEDEEDEYLIIEKEEVEQYMEDSLKDEDSVESHIPEEIAVKDRRDEEEEDEGELHKHLRDEAESEKEKKHELKANGFHEESKEDTTTEEMEGIKDKEYGPLMTGKGEEKEEINKKPDDKPTDIAALEVTDEVNKHEENEKEVPTRNQDEVAVSKEISIETKEQLQEEVQEIIISAKEIVTKTKQESEIKPQDIGEGSMLENKNCLSAKLSIEEKKDTEEGEEVREALSISPEEKLDVSSEKNREVTDDTRDTDQKLDEEEGAEIKAADQRYPAEESQPDERFSTTVESAATTAPTLPEDERIPLDEIKEIVEEKYVKEETKEEKQIAIAIVPQRLEQPTTLPQVAVAAGVGMFDPVVPHAMVHLQRDIVKTPDEVADLPVHEEVDTGMYESDEFSRDFKSKDDIAKKQSSLQEVEDSRQESAEFDVKQKLQVKYGDTVEEPAAFQDSGSVDQGKASRTVADEDETKRTTETESRQKAEELHTPNTDFLEDKNIIENIEKTHDMTEEKDQLRDETDTEDHILATKEAVKTEDMHKLSATTETVLKSDIISEDKTEVHKAISEQLFERFIRLDTESGKVEEPLDKQIDDSGLSMKESTEDVIKSEITSDLKGSAKSVLQTKEESVCFQEENKEPTTAEFKSTKVSRDERQMFDSKAEVKHITKRFIERESLAVTDEILNTERHDEKIGVSETTKPHYSKTEMEAITAEKTDLEKPVPEKSNEKDPALQTLALETSEAEKFELEGMELQKAGKEQKGLGKGVIKTELTKHSEETNQSEKTFVVSSDKEKVLAPEKEFVPDVRSEETVTESKPRQGKTDFRKDEFEDEKLEKDSRKLDEGKSVAEEPRSENRQDFVLKYEEVPKTDSVAEVCEHSIVDMHDVVKQSEIYIKLSETKETSKPSKIGIIESEDLHSNGGHVETKVKDTVAVKENKLTKKATAFNEEKDIGEKDKPSKVLPLKSGSPDEDQTDTSKFSVEAQKYADHSGTKVPVAEGESEDKSSPGTLSITYLEIIDKLQRDSQKMDDSTVTSTEEALPLTEQKNDASEMEHKGVAFAQQVSDILHTSDYKTDEKLKTDSEESVTKTHTSKDTDTKSTDSIQTPSKVVCDKVEEQLPHTVEKTDKVDSEKTVEEEEPLNEPCHLKPMQDITECVPGISKEEYSETQTDSAKSFTKAIFETKSDQVSDACKLEESTSTAHLPELTDSEDMIKGNSQKTATDKSTEEVDRSNLNVDKSDIHVELKQTEDKDDSYGDGSISPSEAYVDSGLEEEPIYGKLEAAEVAEHVTVTPDSAPPSPQSQKSKKSPQAVQECALQQEQLATYEAALEDVEKFGNDEDTQQMGSITFHEDIAEAKHEPPVEDLACDKGDRTVSITEETQDSVFHVTKEEIHKTATADMPVRIPITTAVSDKKHDISIIPSSDPANQELDSSILKMQEIGEANVLDDLVSASKPSVAEFESKISTQVEEIVTEPSKEIYETKLQIQESNSEVVSDKTSSTIDKDLTGIFQLSEEEMIRGSKETKHKKEAKSSLTSVTEDDRMILETCEEFRHEATSDLTEADTLEEAYKSPEKKQGPTEENLSTVHTAETSATKEAVYSDHEPLKSSNIKQMYESSVLPTSDKVSPYVTSETGTSEPIKTDDTYSKDMEHLSVTVKKEMIVATTTSSSDATCMATSSITEIKATTVTSNIASATSAKKEEDTFDSDLTSSITACHMVVTASSEGGGIKKELSTSGSVAFRGSTAPATANSATATQEIPVSSSSSVKLIGLTSIETVEKGIIKEHTDEIAKESINKEGITQTFITDTRNGDGDHECANSADDREESGKLVTKMTKEMTKIDDDIEPGVRENVEEFTTKETGDNGKIITKTVKTTRTFVPVEGEESDDSDFEDEENVESTAATDGSNSNQISKGTDPFTAVTERDENGIRCLSADNTAGTGNIDLEIVTKMTTTTNTAVAALSDNEASTIETTTATKERIPEVGITTHDSKDIDELSKKENFSQPSSTDSNKLGDLPQRPSPMKVTTTNISHDVPAETDTENSLLCVADWSKKEEEKRVVNGKEGDKESRTAVLTSVIGESAMGDVDESSFVSGVKKEVSSICSELTHSTTPGSDVFSGHDIEIGCGPSSPHSDMSSGQVGREGRSDSQHCDSDEDDEDDDDDDDDPGSPLSVTSQLAHSPPSNFYYEMGDRNRSGYDCTSVKHTVGPFAMTSSLYGSLPPDPLQELAKKEKETQSCLSETSVRYSGNSSSGESVMMTSFYGSLEEDKDTKSIGAEHSEARLQGDELLDFERAKYEHRAARGKDLTPTGSSCHSESTSSSRHITSKHEQYYMSEINGQKQKGDSSYQELTESHANGNFDVGRKNEDFLNQRHEIKEKEYSTKTGEGLVDPLDSAFHQELYRKETEHISANILKDKKDALSMDTVHDPKFQSQVSAPATSALSFPDPPHGFAESSVGETDNEKKDPIADWGEPLGLPAPVPPPTNNINTVGDVSPGTPKKEKKVMQSKKTLMMNESNKAASGKDGKTKRPESPIKQPSSERKGSSNKEGGRSIGGAKGSGSSIYIDLTYVPHHGNSYYTTLEFFKKVRARYYVFSGTEPSREVYNALLDAKQTWEDKELGNSIKLMFIYVLAP